MADMLQVTLVHSPIGYPDKQRKVLRALGLGKMNSSVIKPDGPSIRGMIRHVRHLVSVTAAEPEGSISSAVNRTPVRGARRAPQAKSTPAPEAQREGGNPA